MVDIPDPDTNSIKCINEHYGLEDEDTIMRNEQKDNKMIKIAQANKDYSIQNFHGTKYSLICRSRKIVVPK